MQTELPTAPLDEIEAIFDDFLQVSRGEQPERSYPEGLQRLAYKDPQLGRNGASGDVKRMFDLNPKRLAKLGPLSELEPPPLRAVGLFWEQVLCASRIIFTPACCRHRLRIHARRQVAAGVPKLLRALEVASGSADMPRDDKYDFRMVDYYEIDRCSESEAAAATVQRRCREHRDFGTLSLIFSRVDGLEALVNDQWRPIPPPPAGAAVLLFGWVAQIRSNGRLSACLHRVGDAPRNEEGRTTRRASAVLFAAPQDLQEPLEPVVREGEQRRYIAGVSAEAQQMYAAGAPPPMPGLAMRPTAR